jgi:uncharacterized protein YeaO (DUF488 family)
VSRKQAKLSAWERDLAPSRQLREWFAHRPERFDEFRSRYIQELSEQRDQIAELRRRARTGPLTLIHAARDAEHNDAVVLAEVLRRGLPATPRRR